MGLNFVQIILTWLKIVNFPQGIHIKNKNAQLK